MKNSSHDRVRVAMCPADDQTHCSLFFDCPAVFSLVALSPNLSIAIDVRFPFLKRLEFFVVNCGRNWHRKKECLISRKPAIIDHHHTATTTSVIDSSTATVSLQQRAPAVVVQWLNTQSMNGKQKSHHSDLQHPKPTPTTSHTSVWSKNSLLIG